MRRRRWPIAAQLALACLLPGLHGQAGAQLPDAGRALREAAPPAAAPGLVPLQARMPVPATSPPTAGAVPASQASFLLRAIDFSGNTVFDEATLQAQVADKIGQRVSVADLKALAARVTALYRDAGYILTDTALPSQEIADGKVTLSVLEGALGRIRIERMGDVPVPEALIEEITAQLPSGRPLTQKQLERAMLLLSDTPGMATQAALESGDAPGTFDLLIEARAAPRTSISVDLDNQGSASTGKYRIGVLGRLNSPFRRGDNLDLRLLNSFGKGLTFGRLAYEMPLGASGLRASVAAGRIDYALGQDFAALDAHGSADVIELGLSYPLLRSRQQNLFGKATLDYRQLDDRIGAIDQVSRKRVGALDVGLVYERRDAWLGGGYLSAGADLFGGHLALRSQQDVARDQAADGRHTQGDYARATYQLARLQTLGTDLSAYAALAGQWANRNLDSADKIAAGGPRTVRAYSAATGIGDEAAIVNLELRWSAAPDTTASAFYDIARVRLNHAAPAGEMNRLTLSGLGIGLYQGLASGMALRASAAWPKVQGGAAAPGLDAPGARVYFQIVKSL